jgi:hypothetical protein
MPRPESNNIDEALKPAKPATPTHSASKAASSLGDTLRSYAHKAADMAVGGADSTLSRATKNMNYGVGGSFNHAREDD